jgi:hypothetical protein
MGVELQLETRQSYMENVARDHGRLSGDETGSYD